MKPNPIIKDLGFADTDRLVIVHVDDVGMCRASLQAFIDLWELGTVSSGAVMVPCPWFPAVAAWARKVPDVDLGIHATLNAEFDTCRWGPLSTREVSTGLLDSEGYFHRTVQAVVDSVDPSAVHREIEQQVQIAENAGMDLTHIDSHMGTVIQPPFIEKYIDLLQQFSLPGIISRRIAPGIRQLGFPEKESDTYTGLVGQLEKQDFPMIDSINFLPLNNPDDLLSFTRRVLKNLEPGITHFLLHPAVDSPELRAIAPDWPSRVANYEVFRSPEIRQVFHHSGVQVIGYRPIRDWYRNQKKIFLEGQ